MVMKTLHLLAVSAVASAVLIFAASEVDAQARSYGPRNNFSGHSNLFSWERGGGRHHGFHGGFGNVWVVEREVPVYIEVPTPAPPPPADANSGTLNRDVPEIARKPYVIGASYASLPGGCMKMIEEGVSFYYCSGEWYRQVGEGRSASYRAVARRL